MRVIKKREGEGVKYCYLNKIRKGLIIWHLSRSLGFKSDKETGLAGEEWAPKMENKLNTSCYCFLTLSETWCY